MSSFDSPGSSDTKQSEILMCQFTSSGKIKKKTIETKKANGKK